MSDEDPRSGVGSHVSSHQLRAEGQDPAHSHLGSPGYATQHVGHRFCFFSLTGLALFPEKDKHTLKTLLLIIKGEKRDSKNPDLHLANGQKGVS